MQTFLPYKSFEKTAKALDYKRLGKQRVEAKQLLNALKNEKHGWRNHPACKMWDGYREALKLYHNAMIIEWKRRGYNNSMPLLKINEARLKFPPWLGKKKLHSSHRAKLLGKDPEWYGQWKWEEHPLPANAPYQWPIIIKGDVQWRDMK